MTDVLGRDFCKSFFCIRFQFGFGFTGADSRMLPKSPEAMWEAEMKKQTRKLNAAILRQQHTSAAVPDDASSSSLASGSPCLAPPTEMEVQR